MNQLEILKLLLQATKQKNVQWVKLENDVYETWVEGSQILIEFKYPLLPDETTSGADIVHVSVLGLGMTYFNGTEGMSLVLEILAAGFPEWADWKELITGTTQKVMSSLTKLTQNI